MNSNALADAVRTQVLAIMNSNTTALPDGYLFAQWQEEEAYDSNLSILMMPDGNTVRGVPKGAHVTDLVWGDSVLCAFPRSGPCVIICKVVGKFATFEV